MRFSSELSEAEIRLAAGQTMLLSTNKKSHMPRTCSIRALFSPASCCQMRCGNQFSTYPGHTVAVKANAKPKYDGVLEHTFTNGHRSFIDSPPASTDAFDEGYFSSASASLTLGKFKEAAQSLGELVSESRSLAWMKLRQRVSGVSGISKYLD